MEIELLEDIALHLLNLWGLTYGLFGRGLRGTIRGGGRTGCGIGCSSP